ncbi:G-type lectin S-receptor-like serine/threonine-protein kinase [Dichanthelium oligosanthes]|uniref:non-specific serine/threonine protein kinase n=1 Tax=Dichanthelium oligosanthes TaxID=888268 RepID=A0A1E5URK1_9POAL|nr:G-type lectin S-receptor-like serine/threonine-protein kinase [Dichanthelium oligosanthes]
MAPLYVILGGLLVFSSLHTPSCSAAPANGDTLTAGQALAAGDKLVSRNGKFALGFFQFQAPPTSVISKFTDITTTTTSTSLGWYLGIWFNKIPVFTPVWVANRDKPISGPELNLTQLKISRDGNLAIILSNNATTESIIWSTTHTVNGSIETSTKSTSVVLMNTGNLALAAESPSNATLWQSFDYPTDVGLPGSKIGRNKVTGFNRQFISKKSLIDPGLGSYNLEIDNNGAMLLGRRHPPFVASWSWPSGKLADALIPLLNGLLDSDPRTKGLFKPAYFNTNEEEYFTYTSLKESSYTFVSIDTSGQVKLHVWSHDKQLWETIYSQPSDLCTTYAVCGPFTVCNDNSSPSCDCMETFSLKLPQDWELGDLTGGCVRNNPLDCTTSNSNMTSSTDVFHTIPCVTLPYDPRSIEDVTTQSKCAEACLSDCSCTAYSFKNSRCSIWLGDLLNLNQDNGNSITSEYVLYLRLATKDLLSLRNNDKRKPRAVTAASIISFGLLILVLLLVFWSKKFKCCGTQLHGIQGSGGGIIVFRYTDLGHATKSFSERLGGGGFGSVFKGVLGDKTNIAVKRLDGARQGEKQFRAEVSSIGLVQHINLVKLIGFCCEGDKRILVYEHMSNGSLEANLFQSNATVLNWSIRYQIAVGVARGLSYLHQSCHECIIHCDIKPENILLDASFIPKIADFGMAAIVGRNFSRVLTTFRGTAGYLAPEWLSGVAVTPKVDVYSFGMVLLEIISGKRNSPDVCTSTPHHVAFFPVRAISQLHEGDVRSLVDPRLQGDFDLEEVERVFKVAFWCIQDDESDRPTMVEVVRALEGLQGLDMPPIPRLLAAITKPSDAALISFSDSPKKKFQAFSSPCLMPPLYILLAGLLLFSSLYTPSCSATTTNVDTLVAGQALAVGDKLVSRNGKFALGFFQFHAGPGTISKSTDDTTSSSPGWYLGIWFNKIPVFTTVWVANREKPISDPELKLTQLKITRDGNLIISILHNASTESIIWSTESTKTSTNSTTTVVVLRNNGNLALISGGSSSNGTSLWQSFDYPTDVGLPGAKLGRDKVTGLNRRLISKKSLIDPGLGSYILELDTNGVLSHRRRKPRSVIFWQWSPGKLASTLVTVLNGLLESDPRTKGLLKPEYVNKKEEEYFTYTSLDESSTTFVSVDISGQIKLNLWSQAKQSWQTIYAQPADPCSMVGVCGPYTICNGNSRPFCGCMESFSPKSPQRWEVDDDPTGGCVRNTPLRCTASNKNMSSPTDMFYTIARVTFPDSPKSIEDATTQSQCAEACLSDCSCTAYSYNNNRCSVWHGDLLSVNRNDGIDNFSENNIYLRLAARDLQRLKKNNKRKPGVVISASIVSCGLLIFILLLVIRSNKFKWCGVLLHGSQGGGVGIIAFRYTDLGHATKNFTQRLGGGGFGSVFKGVLCDRTAIAVKRLDGARQGEKQFRAEVSSIGLIQHINLVKLIGFCCQDDKRLLVYEHMSNGSLDAHLFQSNAATILNWSTRYQIAIGVARGLSYLHQSCRQCIIHCDIKPENILLDASFVSKIADFGMAAIVGRDFSRVLTTFRGTAGYLAPEWLSGVAITPKVDVYSFGMVLLEIISGRRNSPEVYTSNGYHVAYFPVQAIRKLHEGDVRSSVDPQLQGNFNSEEVERVFKVAFWCIQDNETDRPSMVEVVRVLEGLQELDMPPVPRLLAAILEPSDAA